jgi:K+/H+ antiporter YhaU regulatory subunit KhtT
VRLWTPRPRGGPRAPAGGRDPRFGASEFNLEEIVVTPGCAVCDLPLRELKERGISVSVVAIQHDREPTQVRPGADDVIRAGDHVVAVGDRENLRRLAEIVSSTS